MSRLGREPQTWQLWRRKGKITPSTLHSKPSSDAGSGAPDEIGSSRYLHNWPLLRTLRPSILLMALISIRPLLSLIPIWWWQIWLVSWWAWLENFARKDWNLPSVSLCPRGHLEEYFWRQTMYNAPLTMIYICVERHNLWCCVSQRRLVCKIPNRSRPPKMSIFGQEQRSTILHFSTL